MAVSKVNIKYMAYIVFLLDRAALRYRILEFQISVLAGFSWTLNSGKNISSVSYSCISLNLGGMLKHQTIYANVF